MHHTKDKGDLAVAKVIADLTEKGYFIYLPISEHGRADLIAESENGLYKIQVKYSSNGTLPSCTSWCDKNGNHKNPYKEGDFDYYGLYLPKINKIVYAPFSYAGKCIKFKKPKYSNYYYWYEDFLELGNSPQKRKIDGSGYDYEKNGEKLKKISWPTKEELQKLVLEKPTVVLSKELGVSDSAIGKKCRLLGINKPPRGYWEKVHHKGP